VEIARDCIRFSEAGIGGLDMCNGDIETKPGRAFWFYAIVIYRERFVIIIYGVLVYSLPSGSSTKWAWLLSA
jgi:hypothetical protein